MKYKIACCYFVFHRMAVVRKDETCEVSYCSARKRTAPDGPVLLLPVSPVQTYVFF